MDGREIGEISHALEVNHSILLPKGLFLAELLKDTPAKRPVFSVFRFYVQLGAFGTRALIISIVFLPIYLNCWRIFKTEANPF